MPDPASFDHSRAAAFEERFIGVLNFGALCLMTSLGHRVGLFDAMADKRFIAKPLICPEPLPKRIICGAV